MPAFEIAPASAEFDAAHITLGCPAAQSLESSRVSVPARVMRNFFLLKITEERQWRKTKLTVSAEGGYYRECMWRREAAPHFQLYQR
jgi:hypothetical protein